MKKIASLLMVIFVAFGVMSWSVFAEDNGAVTEDPEPAIEEVEEGSGVAGNPVVTEENEDSVSPDESQSLDEEPSITTNNETLDNEEPEVQDDAPKSLTSGPDSTDTGKGGESITWSLDDGILTISGSGPMEDYETASAIPWYSDRANIVKVVIGDGITHIGARSFYSYSNLKEIKIGNAVTSIGAWAIYNLSSIEKLIVPSSVETLENSSIRSCASLKNVCFTGNAPTTGTNLFAGCADDFSIRVHEDTTGWDTESWTSYNLIRGCFGDLSVVNEPTCTEKGLREGICIVCGEQISEEIPALGHNYVDGVCTRCGDIEIIAQENGWILYGNGLLNIEVMSSWLTSSDVPWFSYRNKIKEVNIENGVTKIGKYAFSGCSYLTNITIPDSVTR